jgi:hypothetical protein
MCLWKNHIYCHEIQLQIFHFLVSDTLTWPNCSHNLKKCLSSWYICTKTWKVQLKAVTMALLLVTTSSVHANSHLNWYYVQDTESYVISCNFLKLHDLWSQCDCQSVSDEQNQFWQSRFHNILRYCLQSIRCFLSHQCFVLKAMLWFLNFQQKLFLLHWKIYYQRFL